MINCRPTTTTYNNTDGVNFDESTNGKLSNAFLYTGDDSMATKNEEPSGTINTKNILHEKVVCYSNSVGCKVGTKTMGTSIDGVIFRDIDVVKAGRALNIDAYDTAVVQNTRFENIRIEAADSTMIDMALDMPPTWRTAANTSIIKDTYFTNISSDVKKPISLHGKSASVNIVGVHFSNLDRHRQRGDHPDRRRRHLEHQRLRLRHHLRPLSFGSPRFASPRSLARSPRASLASLRWLASHRIRVAEPYPRVRGAPNKRRSRWSEP